MTISSLYSYYVNKPTDKEDEILNGRKEDEILLNDRDENWCMLYLGGDCYVVAKEYKDEIIIHIRNYVQRGAKKIQHNINTAFNLR
jgi:hypothetical protein